jgi:hypothetical protein
MGEGKAFRTGDEGNSNNIVNRQADPMKSPSSAASIAYSGQCNPAAELSR